MFKVKLDKSLLFVILLGVLILANLGFTIKEAFTNEQSDTDSKGNRRNSALEKGDSYDPFLSNIAKDISSGGAQSALPRGIPAHQINPGDENLYILKSEVVPPVCPKCPDSRSCPRPTPCPPCPSCARCPEPAFECKKIPTYSSTNSRLPRPFLNDFSQFT